MSELAVPQTLAGRIGAGRLGALGGWVAHEALPIMAVSICAIELLTVLPLLLGADGWLTLLGGRIVAGGLPQHETLTAWAYGAGWVDQQWLAQLVFHGAYVAGGIKLTLLLHASLAIGAFTGAVVAARLRGGSPSRVAAVAVVCLPIVVFAWPLRRQPGVSPVRRAPLATRPRHREPVVAGLPRLSPAGPLGEPARLGRARRGASSSCAGPSAS